MLSVIRSATSGIHYGVFTSGNIIDGFDVKITNGCDLFCHEGPIKEESHKPQSRTKESAISYMNTVYKALTKGVISKSGVSSNSDGDDRFVHEFNHNEANDTIQLVIKERVPNTITMSILFRSVFNKQYAASSYLPPNTSPIMDLFIELQLNLTSKQQTITGLEEENKQYQEQILNLLQKNKRVALTCFEANICQCHRKHLAESIVSLPDWNYELKHI